MGAETHHDACMALMAIPGYKGYTPGFARSPIPIKVSKQRLGVQPDAATCTEAAAAAPRCASEYAATFAPPAARRAAPQSGTTTATATGGVGGYWFEERSRAASGRPQPFVGTTTYRAELLGGGETAGRQLAASAGVPATLVGYAPARAAAACGCAWSAVGARTGVASRGALCEGGAGAAPVGWRTTYGSANVPVQERAAARAASAGTGAGAGQGAWGTGASSAAGAAPGAWGSGAATPTAGEPSGMTGASGSGAQSGNTHSGGGAAGALAPGARFGGASTYSRDFNGDPVARAGGACEPRVANTLLATTRDLNEGTTRACHHVPGYTGFVPAAATNAAARSQGAGAIPRADGRPAMLLCTLDQFGRARLPGYTGYKPAGGAGATAEQPAQGPTAATATGFVNAELLKRSPQPHDPAHCIDSRRGLMSFFSSGCNGSKGEPSISDNGLCDAQKFFVRLRPLEGRMKGAAPSRTTHSGARFDSPLAKAAARR